MENNTTPIPAGDSSQRCRLIVSSSQAFLHVALRELERVNPSIRELERFGCGVFMTGGSLSAAEMAHLLQAARPVFIKHVMPVAVTVPLSGDTGMDLDGIVQAALSACPLEPPIRFAVQCRCVSPALEYRAKDVEVAVGAAFEARGCVPAFDDCRVDGQSPGRIISAFVSGLRCYLGCSTAVENLNVHCDEYRVCSRTGKEISRAEYKLEEAIRTFGLRLSGGRALDLGASPGGWTSVLARRGMSVVAVDRAALDERVLRLPSVTSVRCGAELYRPEGMFDLVVNDMNIEPEASARIVLLMCPSLRSGGRAVMTAKHTTGDPEEQVERTLAILRETLEISGVRHLFHNRREVTICLRKPR